MENIQDSIRLIEASHKTVGDNANTAIVACAILIGIYLFGRGIAWFLTYTDNDPSH